MTNIPIVEIPEEVLEKEEFVDDRKQSVGVEEVIETDEFDSRQDDTNPFLN